MADQNAGGRHARHGFDPDQEPLGMDNAETKIIDGGSRSQQSVRGAHAGMDLEETRRLDEADKTAVLDFLYGDGSAAGSSQATQVRGQAVGGRSAYASEPSSARSSEYGSFDSQKTQFIEPLRDYSADRRSYGDSASNAGPYGNGGYGFDSEGLSTASYVNNTPNAEVVGFSKNPGKDFNIDAGLKGRAARKAARQRSKSGKSSAGSPAVFGSDAVSAPQGQSRRKRRGCLSRILGSLLKLVLVIALICAVPLGFFCYKLDQALALTNEERAAIESELTPAGIGKPYYALLMGSDSRSGTVYDTGYDASERSDVIMLVRVDPLGDQVTIVSVPRDTPYRTDDGSLVKINEAYNQDGAAGIIRAVSDVTGVPISHYAEVGFSDLSAIVDSVGGVTVDVDNYLSLTDPLTGEYVSLEPGTQTLDGQEALVFARARHEYVYDQDAHRQSNDRALLQAIGESIAGESPLEIPGTTLDVASYIITDVKSVNLLAAAAPMFLIPGKTTVYSCTGPYAGEINYESGGLWLCYEDPEGWANLMSVVDAGDDPSSVSFGY